MNIVAGMILLCSMRVHTPNGFLKDVETKVWYVKPNGDAFVEYNLKVHKAWSDLSIDENYDILNISSMKDPNYGNCKEIK